MSTSTSNMRKIWKPLRRYIIMLLIVFKWLFILGIIAGIFGGAAVYGYVASIVKEEPVRSPDLIYDTIQQNTVTGYVFFRDGTEVGQLRGINRELVERLEDVPQIIQDAVLAVEDHDFYKHFGINLKGLLRAVKERVLNEEVQTGGSTITQQVARNTFLSLERTTSRKVKEILLAIRLERVLTKKEILLAYLNKVPFGNGSNGYNVYGIKAAAKGIFDVDNLHDLNIAQAAYLAGLPQDPTDYSAFDGYGRFDEEGFQNAMNRQKTVLYRMYVTGKITREQYEEALAFDIRGSLAESKPKAYTTYPFLMIEAEREAAEILLKQKNPELTEEELRSKEFAPLINEAIEDMLGKGYRIYTTIDKDLYDAMREIAENPENFTPDHEEKGVEQVGAIVIENKTGAILGMIEGRDFHIEQLNHATQMVRQPGSAMKTIAAFLPALEKGYIQPGSILDDVPIVLEDGSKGYHIPNNWNARFQGLVTARYALNQSLNIPALRLFNDVVTIPVAWEFAKSLGITTITENDYHHKVGVIGGLDYGTSVEELANAYASIPNKGKFVDAYMIERIEDPEGNIVYQHEPEPKPVFSEETAFLMADMLKTVIQSGTGSTIKSTFKHYGEVEVAGKTGSTQIDDNMWFMGFSPDITVGVWTGYDQPATVDYNHGGQHRAKNIWSMIMDAAIELKPEWFEHKQFERPENVIRATVSGINGKLPGARSEEIKPNVTDWFNRLYLPKEEDASVNEYKYVQYQGLNYLPGPNTPEDMIREGVLFEREINLTELMQRIDTILEQLPDQHKPRKKGGYMTVRDYYPPDAALTAPSMPLPEVEDDGPPAPPTGLTVQKVNGQYMIRFSASPSQDVLGYRYYVSVNGEPFRRINGKVVFPDKDPAFYQPDSPGSSFAWYLTAVDVHGHESAPSEIVYSDPQDGLIPLPGMPGAGDPGEPANPDDRNTSEPGHAETLAPSAPQNVQTLAVGIGEGVIISWDANPVEESVLRYEVYYSSERDGNYGLIGTTNASYYQNGTPPLEGWYRVAAVNAHGSSELSEPVFYEAEETQQPPE